MTEKSGTNTAPVRSPLLTRTKKSTAAGAIVSLAVIAFVLSQVKSYLSADAYGGLMLAVSLACGILIAPAIAFKPDREAANYPLWVFLVFMLCPMLDIIGIERMNGNFIGELIQACWIDNYLVCLLIYLALFCVTGSARVPALAATPVLFVFGLANMYLKEFRGEPLVPMDMGSVSTAMTVARGYTYSVGVDVSFAVAVMVLAMALSSRLSMPPMKRKTKIASRLAVAVLVSGIAFCFYATDMFVNWGYKPDFFNQMRGYNNKGALLEFTVNTRYLHRSPPEGYDPDQLSRIVEDELASYDGKTITENALAAGSAGKSGTDGRANKTSPKTVALKKGEKPDIIVVMDEAFSDLEINGDVETSEEVMPNMERLKKESLQGYAYVSVFGAGTSNTEFEFLTGDPMAFLPPASNAYQLYVQEEQPGLALTLKKAGYTTHAFHPYFRGNWNRPRVYESMGFDDYHGIEDMFSREFVDAYTNNPNAKYTLNKLLEEEGKSSDIFLRRYVSDAYDFSELITRYEKRDKSKPYFMFNVTMQNHSPYDLFMDTKYDSIKLRGLTGTYPKTEQYLSIIHQTDKALGDLVAYFEKADRPVMIFFFGDHQPSIENDFYEEVTGTAPSDMEGMTLMDRYSTRFMMWSNFGTPAGWTGNISTNYLSAMMMENTGLEMTDFMRYLQAMYEKYPVVTGQGCVAADGTYNSSAAEAGSEDLDDYAKLVYNNLSDEENRSKDIFY